jgi:hypothetical protein
MLCVGMFAVKYSLECSHSKYILHQYSISVLAPAGIRVCRRSEA